MGGGNKPKQNKARREEIKRRLKNELKKELKPLIIGTMAMISSAAANQAIPKILGKVLDQNTSSKNACVAATNGNGIVNNSLLLVVLGGGLSSFLRTTMLNRAQDSIASRLRSQVFEKLMKRNIEWYQTGSSAGATEASGDGDGDATAKDDGTDVTTDKVTATHLSHQKATTPAEIQSILSEDVNHVSETITTTIANTIRSAKSVIFATKNMLEIDPHLLSISIGVVPVIGTAAFILNKFVKKIVKKHRDLSLECDAFAAERVENLSMVKISSREDDEIQEYLEMQEKVKELGKVASWAKGIFMGFMFSASSAALVMVFHVGGRDVARGRLTHGELKSFATYTFMLGLGTSGIMRGLGNIVQGLVAADRVYDLLDGDGDGDDDDVEEKDDEGVRSSHTSDITADVVDTISISNVSFTYASNQSDIATLKDINLDIARGQVIALVGKNGAGKSTLAKLLVALYKPKSGTVTAKARNDNADADVEMDVHTLDRKTQSQLVQLVPQQPTLFNMSVMDNVKYTNPTATNEEVEKALEAANCTDFVSELENGLEYNVGRNGSKLSGGQRQRLALARALLSDPTLLILDEPSSSMDAEGENAVAHAVKACRGNVDGEEKKKKKGLLLISHRAVSLQLADRIVVLKAGEIVEQGSYDELTKNKDSELCQLMPELQ